MGTKTLNAETFFEENHIPNKSHLVQYSKECCIEETEVIRLMEAYHRAKVDEITDDEINIKSSYYDLDVNIALIQAFKDGTKWFKNRLLYNNGSDS